MGWPEYTYLALLAIGVGINLAKDGQPREGKYSFWWAVATAGITTAILWQGGFFE